MCLLLEFFDFIVIQHCIITSDMKVMEVSTKLSRFCPEGKSQYIASKGLNTAVFLPLGTTSKELRIGNTPCLQSPGKHTKSERSHFMSAEVSPVYFKSFVRKSLSVRKFKSV